MFLQIKRILLELGLDRYEVSVILAACDTNVDGVLDPHELDSLKLIVRQALVATSKKEVIVNRGASRQCKAFMAAHTLTIQPVLSLMFWVLL